jgi:hypothetical protein
MFLVSLAPSSPWWCHSQVQARFGGIRLHNNALPILKKLVQRTVKRPDSHIKVWVL